MQRQFLALVLSVLGITAGCSDLISSNRGEIDKVVAEVSKHNRHKAAKCTSTDHKVACACEQKCVTEPADCHCADPQGQ